MNKEWYVVNTVTGYEYKVKTSLWRTVHVRLDKGVGNDYKQELLIKDAYPINVHSLASSCRNGWVQYFCQSKHKRTDLKTARQHQWL